MLPVISWNVKLRRNWVFCSNMKESYRVLSVCMGIVNHVSAITGERECPLSFVNGNLPTAPNPSHFDIANRRQAGDIFWTMYIMSTSCISSDESSGRVSSVLYRLPFGCTSTPTASRAVGWTSRFASRRRRKN